MTDKERIRLATDELLETLRRYDVVLGVDLSDGVHVYILTREEADGPQERAWIH